MKQLDDNALLEQLRAGDGAAYELLVRTYGGRLLAVARTFLRNEDDARDAVQDAFISAFKAIPRFQGDAQLGTWLHRILVNAALMKLRRRRRKPEESIESLLPTFLEDGHHAVDHAEWAVQADKLLESKQSAQMVRAAIAQLPEGHRTVLILRDIEERSTEEVALELGVTANAVKIRLHRARQALGTILRLESARNLAVAAGIQGGESPTSVGGGGTPWPTDTPHPPARSSSRSTQRPT